MVGKNIVGTWKIANCMIINDGTIKFDMDGITFSLGQNGDVKWSVPQEFKTMPLFCCDSYEYATKSYRTNLKFGTYAGQVFDFKVWNVISKDSFRMSNDQLCVMDCIYVEVTYEPTHNLPFSLLPALEDSYFYDVTLVASNRKKFHVHSTILKLLAHDIDWKSDSLQLDGLNEEIVGTILHFLYAESLPENLNESTAKQVKEYAVKYASLSKLVTICDKFISKMQLRRQIIALVNDIHTCMDKIVEYINPNNGYTQQENIGSNLAKLCLAVKQSFKEEVVAIAKFVYLCDLYTKRKHELTHSEEEDLMLLLKSKVPVYNIKFRQFLEGFKKIYKSLSPAQRIEVVSFIVPEIEGTLDNTLLLIEDVNKLLHDIVTGFHSESSVIPVESNDHDHILKRLGTMINRMELRKLKAVQENGALLYEALVHIRDKYASLPNSERIQSLASNLDLFIRELPIYLLRLDDIVDVFDEKMDISEFKFFFKAETSKVAYILQKMREHPMASQQLILKTCEFIERDAFNETVKNLNLLKTSLPEINKSSAISSPSSKYRDQDYTLNLVKSLCLPPSAHESNLSASCLKLFEEQINTDMEFEIVYNSDQVESKQSVPEKCTIKAHRVIVASRCVWFKRALLSGMKEAIDRKIVIHEADPLLFKIMLEFLYSGRLKYNALSTDQVLELLLLSDRYEVDALKRSCENHLREHIDDESVLYFLSLADRYNAKYLKNRCFHYISQNNHITESPEFFQLPLALQAEIFHTISSFPGRYFYYRTTDEEEIAGIQSNGSAQDALSTGLSSTSRLESAVDDLRKILGDSAARSVLIEVVLAADYNLQRAINYYYARGNTSD